MAATPAMMMFAFLSTKPRRRTIAILGAVLLVVGLAWGASLVRFVHLMDAPAQLPQHLDGIVAFTGGPERVETALRLLSEGRADRLLLSGIGGGAELTELAQRAGVDPLPLAARVTMDRNATTTRSNALETAVWARENKIHSLLVVTAAYHMPRALTELERALPEVTLHPLPVGAAGRLDRPSAPLRLIAEEYIKFLASTAGLTAVLPLREVPPGRGGHAG